MKIDLAEIMTYNAKIMEHVSYEKAALIARVKMDMKANTANQFRALIGIIQITLQVTNCFIN